MALELISWFGKRGDPGVNAAVRLERTKRDPSPLNWAKSQSGWGLIQADIAGSGHCARQSGAPARVERRVARGSSARPRRSCSGPLWAQLAGPMTRLLPPGTSLAALGCFARPSRAQPRAKNPQICASIALAQRRACRWTSQPAGQLRKNHAFCKP